MEKRIVALVAGLLFSGLFCLFQAQAQLTLRGVGGAGGGAAAGYSGPGNVVSGAVAYWGASAYTTGQTSNAWNVCNVSDVACADWPIGSNGYVTPSLVGGSDCSVVTCTIKTLYDRSGANSCGGAPCNVTQATIASRAQVAFNALNTFVCPFSAGAAGTGYTIATGIAMSQPVTTLVVAKRDANFTTQGTYWQSNLIYGAIQSLTSGQVQGYAGTLVSASASENPGPFHSIQVVLNTPTSTFQVDSTQTSTGDPGTGTATVAGGINFYFDGGTQSARGFLCDLGIWNTAFSGTNLTNMNTNRHAAYGTW